MGSTDVLHRRRTVRRSADQPPPPGEGGPVSGTVVSSHRRPRRASRDATSTGTCRTQDVVRRTRW